MWPLKSRVSLDIVYLFVVVVGGSRCNKLSFPFEGISQYTLCYQTTRNFTEVKDP